MAIRGVALMPSTLTRTLVCVDEIADGEFVGTGFNIYMERPVRFKSVFEFVIALENFFDKMGFPQPQYEDRVFDSNTKQTPKTRKKESEAQQYMSEDVFTEEQGKKATFVVQVQFRQNATWQGTITWNEEKKTQRFRSTLEMVKLMDNALAAENQVNFSNSGWE